MNRNILARAIRTKLGTISIPVTRTGIVSRGKHAIALLVGSLLLSTHAFAAGSNMPWEAPLQAILDSIEGPVVRIFAVIIIAATGLMLAFGDTSGGFRKLLQIAFGISIAFAATSFFLGFFGYSGGAVVA